MSGTESRPATREHSLSSELRMAIARLARRLRAEKPDGQLSDGQMSALFVLAKHGPQTLGELSERERVTPPSMNRTIGCLADAGYVSRSSSPDDGRKVVLAATDAGLDLIAETRRRRDAWLDRQMNELEPADRDALRGAVELLRRLADS